MQSETHVLPTLTALRCIYLQITCSRFREMVRLGTSGSRKGQSVQGSARGSQQNLHFLVRQMTFILALIIAITYDSIF